MRISDGSSAVCSSDLGRAAISPLRRAASDAAESLRSNFEAGGRAVADAESSRAPDSAAASESSSVTATPPDWAKSLQRSQRVSHAVQTTAHAVRSGDAHGGGSSVNLSEGDK